MRILAYTPDERYLQALGPYLQRQGVAMERFQHIEQFRSVSAVLLFSPIPHEGIYLSPDTAWKAYLAYAFSELQMASAGFKRREPPHSNYIDLLDPPKNLAGFMENTEPVGNTWQPMDTGGVELLDELKKFFDGHGDDSVVDVLCEISDSFNWLHHEMAGNPARFSSALKAMENYTGITTGHLALNWNKLNGRWRRYMPYFHYLPFYEEFVPVGQWIKQIAPFFENGYQGKAFFERQCPEYIEKITSTLKNISHYVPE